MSSGSTPPRSGIIAGGNWLIDHVKLLDCWPAQDSLANILSESWANGGGPYNVLKDLAKLGAPFPLEGIGLVGDDADGQRILDDCTNHRIDTRQLRRTAHAATAYSDVMTEKATGRRTFFYQRGANALLAPEHFDFTITRAKHFHLGYLLLLDGLDTLVGGIPRAVEVFAAARRAGLTTSLDCVSANTDRYQAVVKPVLPHVDLLFVNDFEAEKLTGLALRAAADAPIGRERVETAARRLLDAGVREAAIIHFPEAACAVDRRGAIHWQPSFDHPPEHIKGTAGAGDAFAAGVLYARHEDRPLPEALRFGVCAAASCLSDPTCSGGILPAADCLRFLDTHAVRSLG